MKSTLNATQWGNINLISRHSEGLSSFTNSTIKDFNTSNSIYDISNKNKTFSPTANISNEKNLYKNFIRMALQVKFEKHDTKLNEHELWKKAQKKSVQPEDYYKFILEHTEQSQKYPKFKYIYNIYSLSAIMDTIHEEI